MEGRDSNVYLQQLQIHTDFEIERRSKELEILEGNSRQRNRRWNPDGGADITNQEKKPRGVD